MQWKPLKQTWRDRKKNIRGRKQMFSNISCKKNKKKNRKTESSIWDLWYTFKQQSIHVLGATEAVNRVNALEYIFNNITAENIPF